MKYPKANATKSELRDIVENQTETIKRLSSLVDTQQLSLEAIRLRSKRLGLSLKSIQEICQDLVTVATKEKFRESFEDIEE